MTRHAELRGLVVVVTGGARGIGLATAERFARAGARVALGDRDAELATTAAADLAVRTGARVVAAPLDVTEPASWTAFLAAVADLGPVDVLVNNAGIMPLGPVLEEPAEVARRIFDVNLHGVVNGTKAVAPGMVERGHGHVVNVASAVGRVALAGGASYSASKFAVVGFTEATRAELAPYGVDVAMVLPTVVTTELSAGVPAARGVKPVSAEDVAAVIERAVRRPTAEQWVPRWSKSLARGADLMPRRLKAVTARALRADSALDHADPAARAAYEDRVRRS
ncbi:SDR family oxidoreductase [Nocardioides dongkuii]|uniref:SDR family oxidoreductase n=1 Tax=Nocardioides dongkuii TaxID=2760089 RepID=UPI0015FC2AC2|nr:SDR family oxidoreductase [Nocardioides dongkuii]